MHARVVLGVGKGVRIREIPLYSEKEVIQRNLSNPDTNGAEESFIVSEVFLFQRLKCM